MERNNQGEKRISLGAIGSETTAQGMIDLDLPMVKHLETRKKLINSKPKMSKGHKAGDLCFNCHQLWDTSPETVQTE